MPVTFWSSPRVGTEEGEAGCGRWGGEVSRGHSGPPPAWHRPHCPPPVPGHCPQGHSKSRVKGALGGQALVGSAGGVYCSSGERDPISLGKQRCTCRKTLAGLVGVGSLVQSLWTLSILSAPAADWKLRGTGHWGQSQARGGEGGLRL